MGAQAVGVSTFGKGYIAPNNAGLQDLKAGFFSLSARSINPLERCPLK
jgi:hypothetical protein